MHREGEMCLGVTQQITLKALQLQVPSDLVASPTAKPWFLISARYVSHTEGCL